MRSTHTRGSYKIQSKRKLLNLTRPLSFMRRHDELVRELCNFLTQCDQVDYIADHGAGRRLRGSKPGSRKLAVGGRRPDIHMWIDGVSYCVNVTSGSLLKRNRLLGQIQAWQEEKERILCIVSESDQSLLIMALQLVGVPPVDGALTVEGFKEFVYTRLKKISSDTPKPLEIYDVDK